MASQEEFFASLSRSSIESTDMPEIPVASLDSPPRERFIEVLKGVGGRLGDSSDINKLQQKVDELIAKKLQVLSLVEGVYGNRDPSAVRDPHDLKDIDYTIAPARLAVAENGAVWFNGDDLITRNAVFICEHLIAVVDENKITGTMSEAIGDVGRLGGGWGVFVSGPSKTADIEQSLVIGAHGARSMTVYLIQGN